MRQGEVTSLKGAGGLEQVRSKLVLHLQKAPGASEGTACESQVDVPTI